MSHDLDVHRRVSGHSHNVSQEIGADPACWPCQSPRKAAKRLPDDRFTTAYSVMKAMNFIVPPHLGQTIGLTSYFRPHRHPSLRVFDDPPRPGERRWAQGSRDVNLDIVACLQDGARALDGNPSAFLFISFLPWCNILLEEAP